MISRANICKYSIHNLHGLNHVLWWFWRVYFQVIIAGSDFRFFSLPLKTRKFTKQVTVGHLWASPSICKSCETAKWMSLTPPSTGNSWALIHNPTVRVQWWDLLSIAVLSVEGKGSEWHGKACNLRIIYILRVETAKRNKAEWSAEQSRTHRNLKGPEGQEHHGTDDMQPSRSAAAGCLSILRWHFGMYELTEGIEIIRQWDGVCTDYAICCWRFNWSRMAAIKLDLTFDRYSASKHSLKRYLCQAWEWSSVDWPQINLSYRS